MPAFGVSIPNLCRLEHQISEAQIETVETREEVAHDIHLQSCNVWVFMLFCLFGCCYILGCGIAQLQMVDQSQQTSGYNQTDWWLKFVII